MSIKRIDNPTYQVTLTRQQAFILLRLLNHVGGNPNGPRGEIGKLEWDLEQFAGDFEDEPRVKFIDPLDDRKADPTIYIEKGE